MKKEGRGSLENKHFRINKAQTTIFIIIAILIVVIVGVFLFFNMNGKHPIFKTQLDSLKDSIILCSKNSARDGIKRIGIQGGYYDMPKNAENLGWAFIPYYYNKGDILSPDKATIEKEISKYIDSKLNYCIDGLSKNDYELIYNKSKTITTISPKKIRFSIDLPITITKGEEVSVFELKNNEIVFNSSLYEIYEVADFITKSHKENESLFCASCVVEMAKERNLYVDLIDYKDSSTLVMLSENWSYQEPYLFEFLNKY